MPINLVHELTDMSKTDQVYTRLESDAFADNPSVFQIKYGINGGSIKKRLSSVGALDIHGSLPSHKQIRLDDSLPNDHAEDSPGGENEDLKDGIVVKSEPVEADERSQQDGHLCLDLSDKKPRCGGQGGPRQPGQAFAGKSSPKGFESSCYSPGGRDTLPDSSTGTCEQMTGVATRISSVSSADDSGSHLTTSTSTSGETILCQVCGDLAAGFYCGAYICEACKKFFIRASKLERPRYVCLRQKDCVITKESRVHCQYCRYQKCLELNMYYPNGQKNANKVGVQEIPCRVCSAPSSGFHFGALTCEGCKGFFRRMVKEREAYSYKCSKSGNCEVNAMTRNMCKACRYTKCIQIGMSVDGSRIGRQPNAVKHAISLEAKKQIALKSEPHVENTKMDVGSPTNFNLSSVVLDPCLPGDVDDSLQSLDQHGHQGSSPSEIRNPAQENQERTKHCPDVESSFHGGCSSDRTTHLDNRLPLSSHYCPKEISCNHYDYPHGREAHHPFLTTEGPCVPDYHDHPQQQDVCIDLSMRRSPSSSGSSYPSTIPQPTTACCSVSQYPPHGYSSGPLSPQISGQERSRHHACGPQRPSHCSHQNAVDSPPKTYNPKKDRYKCGSNNVYRTDSMYGNYGDYVDCHAGFKDGCGDHMDTRSPPYSSCSPYHDGAHPSYHKRSEQDYIQDSQDFHRGIPYQWVPGHHNHSSIRVRNVYYETQPPQHGPDRAYQNHSMNVHNQHHASRDRASSKGEPHHHYHKEKPQHRSVKSPTYPSDREAAYVNPQGHGQCKPEPPATPKQNVNKVIMQFADGRDITYKELSSILSQAANALFHICITDRAKSDVIDEARFITVDLCWEKMMEHFNFHAKCIVRFAKKVPGFRMLKIEDQVLLLRSATYGLVILTHSREYEPETGFYNYFNFTYLEQMKIMDLFPEFNILLSHFKHTGLMAKRLSLTDLEYAYLSCMLLLNDEYQGLIDTKKVKELKEKYLEAFHEYEFGNFSNGDLRFGEMLLRLSEFSQFSMQHNIAVSLVITKNSQLHIPQLYAEMYNQALPEDFSDWSPC